MRARLLRSNHGCRGNGGQSLVEFALVLPVFLLVVLMGIDFGRVFTGWVTLQQAARIAANYASINPATTTADAAYTQLITNETKNINCDLVTSSESPSYTGNVVGTDFATVALQCNFHLLTPIISRILPNPLLTTASSSFPLRFGLTGTRNGGAVPIPAVSTNPPCALPTCDSTSSPMTITIDSATSVQFINYTCCDVTSSIWALGDGSTSTSYNPGTHLYTNSGSTQATYQVTLIACNANGCSNNNTPKVVAIVKVNSAFPVAAFSYSPSSPTTSTPVTFTDASTNMSSAYAPLSWSWTFGDGGTSTSQNPTHAYSTAGTYSVQLTARNVNGSNSTSHSVTVASSGSFCYVPNYTVNDPWAGGPGKWTTSDVSKIWGKSLSGSSHAISAASESGSTVTITTSTVHGLTVGQQVTISGVGVSGYNGTWVVTTIVSTTKFKYSGTSGLGPSSGGTAVSGLMTQSDSGTTVAVGGFSSGPTITWSPLSGNPSITGNSFNVSQQTPQQFLTEACSSWSTVTLFWN